MLDVGAGGAPSAPIKSQLSHAHPEMQLPSSPALILKLESGAIHYRYRNYTTPPLRYLNFKGKLVLKLRYTLSRSGKVLSSADLILSQSESGI